MRSFGHRRKKREKRRFDVTHISGIRGFPYCTITSFPGPAVFSSNAWKRSKRKRKRRKEKKQNEEKTKPRKSDRKSFLKLSLSEKGINFPVLCCSSLVLVTPWVSFLFFIRGFSLDFPVFLPSVKVNCSKS